MMICKDCSGDGISNDTGYEPRELGIYFLFIHYQISPVDNVNYFQTPTTCCNEGTSVGGLGA
jgi:hypothetical protein